MKLSVIIPAYNPHPGRLVRTVAGLRAQTLPVVDWELVIIDNASTEMAGFKALDLSWHPRARIVREPKLGLTAARLRGFAEGSGEAFVMVDDDNVLVPGYLAEVVRVFATEPRLGAVGGRSVPEFEAPPAAWTREFDGNLALRDLGDQPLRGDWRGSGRRIYPTCTPIGAGMALRRSGVEAYARALEGDPRRRAFDRTGTQLISGGDNDLAMTVLDEGLDVGYQPELQLTHLIPTGRSQRKYLGALNRALSRSWVRVLALHGIQLGRPISRATVGLRQARAWVRTKAWKGPAEWVRWQAMCGHFEGLADLGGLPQAEEVRGQKSGVRRS
jgi:glycosyltransferase involved in cell wall biosynthesis